MKKYLVAPDNILDENGGVMFVKGQEVAVDDPDIEDLRRKQGFVDAGTIEPTWKDHVSHIAEKVARGEAGELFEDPTGEDSTPVHVIKSAGKGLVSSVAHGAAGVEKGIVGGVLDTVSAGARVLGGEKTADQLQDLKRSNDALVDKGTGALDDALLGEDPGRAAWDAMMGVSEGLGGIYGGIKAAVPLAARLKGAKVAKTAEGAMKGAYTAQMAAGGEEAARTAILTKKDEQGNPVLDEDGRPVIENRDLTWRERAEVGYHTLKEGITARFFGRIVGAWGKKIGNAGAAALEFGGINAAGVLADAYIGDNIAGREWKDEKGNVLVGNEKDMAVLAKAGAAFAYGGMQSLLMSMGGGIAGRRSEGAEAGRGARPARPTEDLAAARQKAAAAMVQAAADPESAAVAARGANGETLMKNGALVRVAEDGATEIVTPDGVVLDAEGNVKTVAAGNVGETGEGSYGTAITVRTNPLTGRPTAARETVRNALVALQEGVTIDQLREIDGWTPENKAVFQLIEDLRLKIEDFAPGELVDAYARLGISREELTAFGLLPDTPIARDAEIVARNGTTALQSSIINPQSSIPIDIAAEVARSVNAGTTGLMPKELAKRQLETARQIMAERAKAKLEESATEHGNTPEAERAVLDTPVEKEDGTLGTIEDLELKNEDLEPSAGGLKDQSSILNPQSSIPGTANTLRARHEREQSVKALGLKPLGDGTYGVGRFPQMRVEKADGVADDSGRPVSAIRVTGLDPAEMLRPENILDAARVLGDLMEKCEAKGVRVDFEPEAMDAVNEVMAKWETDVRTDPVLRARSEVVTSLLEKSGLASGIVTDQAAFEAAMREKGGDKAEKLIADGQTYGFVDPASGTVYLNPAFFGTKVGLNTPIHEFGHLGIIACKKINRPLYDRGLKLIQDTPYWKEVTEHPDYKNDTPQKNAEEALTRLIADRGEKLAAETPKGVLAEIKQWLVEFWKTFGDALGLRDITPEQVEKMTVEQIADAIRAEMLRGEKFGTSRAQVVAQQQSGRRLKAGQRKRSPKSYIEAGGGKASKAFAFWAENGKRIMNVPKPGEFGWDVYNQLVLGVKDPAERARVKRILCGDQPKNTRLKGNDEILAEFNRRMGGDGDIYTDESGFQQMVEEFLSSHADYERWRAEGAKSSEELRVESEELRGRSEGLTPAGSDETLNSSLLTFNPQELEEWSRIYDESRMAMAEAGLADEPDARVPDDAMWARGRSPREDPLVSNIRERLKFGESYRPEDSHHIAYSWNEIALYHDKGNGEYVILERLPNNRKGYERLREKIRRTYPGRVRDDIDRVVGLARDLARSHRLRMSDAGSGQAGDVRDAGVAARHAGDGAGEADRQGEGTGGPRFSIGGIYTGTAADYANRSRQGGKDDGPSLKKIGTGEGSQVYGWGLYGSNVRGVADRYAKNGRGAGGKDWIKEGRNHDELSDVEKEAASYLKGMGSKQAAIERLKEDIEWFEKQGIKDEAEALKPIVEELSAHGDEYREQHENVYEQTFFTDRAPGDESHLLKWYEPVSEEQRKWIADELVNEGWQRTRDTVRTVYGQEYDSYHKGENEKDYENKIHLFKGAKASELYRDLSELLGTPQAASEFLARAGIDGVKYPVDSYGGKGVKDGDEAGWNYVSFRDDNIRVDHKWTDGQIRFSRGQMSALAKSKVGGWVEGTSADGVRNAIEKRIEEGLPEGEYRFKNAEDRVRLVKGAVKFYKRFAQKTVMLSDGRCVYFVPDERARTRGLSNEEAWAEYAIHAVTSSGKPLEGKGYNERLYNATKAQNIWRIENILKAERCEAIVEDDPQRDSIVFFGRGVKGDVVRIVTRLDERGNVYADLAEVTMLSGGKMKKLPPRKPLTEVVETVVNRRQRGGLLTADAESISQDGADGNGDLRLSRGGYKPGDWRKTFTFGKAARGAAEQTNGGIAAGEERRRWEENPVDERIPEWDAPARNPNIAKPFALSSAEGVRLVKLLGGTMKKPKAYKDAIGVIDESDEQRIRDDLKAMGFFKGDDFLWAATATPAEVAADRADSQAALDARLEKLGEQRLKGEAGGGNRGLVRVSMSQVADLVLSLPAETGGNLGNVRTLAQGIVRGFEKDRTPEQAAYYFEEARNLLDWFYGLKNEDLRLKNEDRRLEPPVESPKDQSSILNPQSSISNPKSLLARAFGAFLEAPDAVAERAPGLYREFVDAISRNDKLLHAFDAIRRTALGEGSAERVYAEIEAGRTARVEEAARRLADEVEKPIGSRLERAKDSFIYNFDDMHGPIFMHITRAQKRQLAELKASLKAGRITQAEYDAATAAFRTAVQGLKIAELKVDRGSQNEIRQYLWDMTFVFEQAKAAGVDPKDAQRYMDLRWIVSTGGRAGARGMSARDAQICLDNMKEHLGDEAFARLEGVSAQFHAVREKNILDDPRLAAMIGQDRVNFYKNNVHYVRTERTRATPEELAKMEADRAAFRRENKGDDDVTAAMLSLLDKTGGRGGGIGNSTWGHALEGSVKDIKDRLAATWRNDTRLMAAMERNDFVLKIRDALLAAKAEGVHDLPGSRGVDYPQNARYGHIRYFENGKQRVLVVPRVLADGYRQVSDAMTGWSAWGKIAHGVFIDWNLAYTLRNMTRNMASNESNIVGMRADNATIVGNAIAPGAGRAASMAAYQIARHLPSAVFRNPFTRAVFGEHVNAAYAGQAQRILELYLDPRKAVERRAAAEEARLRGDTAPAMELDADLELMRFVTKGGALIARFDEVRGAGRDADLFMRKSGLGEIYGEKGPSAPTSRAHKILATTGKVLSYPFRRNAQFNRDLELHAKITAALAIHEMQPGLTAEQVGIEVARRASIPHAERRGAQSKMINYAWNMFFNTALKGGQRFVGNVVRNPRLAGKMAAQSLGPQLFWATMIAGGGLAAVIRNMFGGGDDAEEKARQAGLGGLLDYAQLMHDGAFAASPYLQRFYHWCPLGQVGERYIGIALPRTDEEKMLLPFIDWAAAKFAPQPTDPTATLGDAVKRGVVGTFVPDIFARTPLVAAAQDLLGPILFNNNPMDTYRGTHVYDNGLFQARGESVGDAAAFGWAMAKQVFNDLGGRTIVRPRRNEIEVAEGSGAQPPSFAEKAWDTILNDIPVLSGVLGGSLRMTLTKEQRLDQIEREVLAPIRAVKNLRSEELMKMMLESPVANNGSETPEIKEKLDAWAERYDWDEAERGNVFARAFNGYQAATAEGQALAEQKKEKNRRKRWVKRPESERKAMEAAGLREIQAE